MSNQQGYEREDIINLFQFVDWIMSLPQELEQQFWQEVINLEEERRMPHITSVERIGIQKGIQQGIEQSRQQIKQILLESIEMGLDLKFGSEGLSLLPEISLLEDVEQLRAIQTALRTVNNVEELRRIYQPATQE